MREIEFRIYDKELEKMKDLRLCLEESPIERAYIMRVNY